MSNPCGRRILIDLTIDDKPQNPNTQELLDRRGIKNYLTWKGGNVYYKDIQVRIRGFQGLSG